MNIDTHIQISHALFQKKNENKTAFKVKGIDSLL